jgi:hypothetical protein
MTLFSKSQKLFFWESFYQEKPKMETLYKQRLKVVWAVDVELLSERGCWGSLGFKLLGLLLFGLV